MNRRTENARTLASMLNIGADEAARLLDISIAITFDASDIQAEVIAGHVAAMLNRTVSAVTLNTGYREAAAELVVGAAIKNCDSALRLRITSDHIGISRTAPAEPINPGAHPLLLLIAGCYATGITLRAALPGLAVSAPPISDGLTISIETVFGPDQSWLSHDLELHDCYLAGAGAVGNGFLYALQTLPAAGTLTLVDPDTVSDGNLNRCVWFSDSDIGFPKAERLAALAAAKFPNLKLVPEISTLQVLGKTKTDDHWLRRLIVGIDSRRTRRSLQSEIANEVFDASTTDVREIAIHYHQQPTDTACLACIYHETADELAHERHMAELLGVTVDDIKQHFVSAEAAQKIHARYPDISISDLHGQAYDSLFKALCSEGKLITPENRQVLAPFAFVSVLAGAFLAIEFYRRIALKDSQTFNYWRISPWNTPVGELKQTRLRNAECQFCSDPTLLRVCRQLWGGSPDE